MERDHKLSYIVDQRPCYPWWTSFKWKLEKNIVNWKFWNWVPELHCWYSSRPKTQLCLMLLSVLAIFNLHWVMLLSTKVHSIYIILYKWEVSSFGVEGSLVEKKLKRKHIPTRLIITLTTECKWPKLSDKPSFYGLLKHGQRILNKCWCTFEIVNPLWILNNPEQMHFVGMVNPLANLGARQGLGNLGTKKAAGSELIHSSVVLLRFCTSDRSSSSSLGQSRPTASKA